MAEERLKRNLESAFDSGPDFPHRSWLSRTMAAIELEDRSFQGRSPRVRPSWVMPAIALVLAVAIVSTLLTVSHLLHAKNSVPVQQVPSPQAPTPTPQILSKAAGVDCNGYEPAVVVSGDDTPSGWVYFGVQGPVPVKMLSATTIWARGGLLTTDGGSTWRDMSPATLRQDEPGGLPKSYLPPNFAEFYLDADHAWIVRSYNYGSRTTCYDHLGVFASSNGGRSWQQSAIAVDVTSPGPGFNLNVVFTDSSHGLLSVNSRLYMSSDGGHTWRLASSQSLGPCTNFISTMQGWSGGCGLEGSASGALLLTDDGGMNWHSATLPNAPQCPCLVGRAAFFDESSGVVYASEGSYGTRYLFATSDGGKSWKVLPPLPPTGQYNIGAIDFTDSKNFWYLAPAPNWNRASGVAPTDFLYHSTDGGETWILVQRNTPIILSPLFLHFVDASHGFVAQLTAGCDSPPHTGCSVEVWVTRDGGRTWAQSNAVVS